MQTLNGIVAALRILLNGSDQAEAWRLIATLFAVVAASMLSALAPLALKHMIDAVSSPTNVGGPALLSAIATAAAAYLLALCTSRLLTEFRPALLGGAEQRLFAALRQRYYGHLVQLPSSFHLAKSTATLAHGLQLAISGYQVVIATLFNSLVPVAIEVFTVSMVLAALDQPLLVVSFSATTLAYLAGSAFRRSRLQEAARRVSDASLATHGVLTDGLINCEAIKTFGAESTAGTLVATAADALRDRWALLQRERLLAGLLVTATFAASMATTLWIAAHAVVQGTLSSGGFVLVNLYILQVVRPLEMLTAAARDVSQSLQFIQPLIEVFAMRPECHTDPPGKAGVVPRTASVRQGPGAPRITFHDVHLSHGARAATLRGLNLDIAPGCTLGIAGASGAGKSSLVRLLLRLCDPQGGRILIDGVPTDTLPIAELRRTIAVVPQDTVLFDQSIAFNIGIGRPGAQTTQIERAATLAGIHDFVTSLPQGYATVVGERGLQLSGGERQRIAIARAVLKDPRIYVFDEATSMLDSRTEQAILHNIRTVSAGRTTITVAHRLSALRHADQIAFLGDGRIIEHGTHVALLARDGHYAAMWRAQRAGRGDECPSCPAPVARPTP